MAQPPFIGSSAGQQSLLSAQLGQGRSRNPEYRLAEDLRVATEAPIDFAVGVMSAFLSAVTFILVLWTIGGNLSFNVAGATITIPGFLVIAAVIYAVLASGTMVFIGHRFVAVAENRDQAEAEYRYTLTRLRENAESVALMGGEDEERRTLDEFVEYRVAPLAGHLHSEPFAPPWCPRLAATLPQSFQSCSAPRSSWTAR